MNPQPRCLQRTALTTVTSRLYMLCCLLRLKSIIKTERRKTWEKVSDNIVNGGTDWASWRPPNCPGTESQLYKYLRDVLFFTFNGLALPSNLSGKLNTQFGHPLELHQKSTSPVRPCYRFFRLWSVTHRPIYSLPHSLTHSLTHNTFSPKW